MFLGSKLQKSFYKINVGGVKTIAWGYEVNNLDEVDILIGTPLLQQMGAVIDCAGPTLCFPAQGIEVHLQMQLLKLEINEISAAAFTMWVKQSKKKDSKLQVFTVSMADIDKALQPKLHTNL